MVQGRTEPQLFKATEQNLHEFAVNVSCALRFLDFTCLEMIVRSQNAGAAQDDGAQTPRLCPSPPACRSTRREMLQELFFCAYWIFRDLTSSGLW